MFVLHTHHPSLAWPSTNIETDKCTVALVFVTAWWWSCGLSQSQPNRTLCSLISSLLYKPHRVHTHKHSFSVFDSHHMTLRGIIACWFTLFESGRVQIISMPILMLIFLGWSISHTNTFSGSWLVGSLTHEDTLLPMRICGLAIIH